MHDNLHLLYEYRPQLWMYSCSWLAPWSEVVLENVAMSQLFKKFPAFDVTWRFITVFTRARHLSISWARWIKPVPFQPIYLINFNIILLSISRSSKWSLFVPHPCHHLILFLMFTTRDNICWATEINSCSRATKILGYLVWNPLFVLLQWSFFGLCRSSKFGCDIANQKID